MRKRIVNLALCLLFAMLIAVPLVFADWKGGSVSETENRVKTAFPTDVTLNTLLDGTAQTGLENWIADNACGRETAGKLNTLASYYAWHLSARSDTLIGRDDWFFYYNAATLWDYQHIKTLPDEAIDALVANIGRFGSTLMEEGVPLLVVGVPDKKTVYADQFPSSILTYDYLEPMSDIIADQLAAETDVSCLWLRDALMSAKATQQVYYARYDTAHWNQRGAFVGYREIVNRLTDMGIGVRLLTEDDFILRDATITTLFNGALPLSETDTNFTLRNSPNLTPDPSWFDSFPQMRFSDSPDAYRVRYLNEDRTLPKMVFIGDSYSIALTPFLSACVSEYTFVHLNDLASAAEVIKKAQPDVVVLEYVERMTRDLSDQLAQLYD